MIAWKVRRLTLAALLAAAPQAVFADTDTDPEDWTTLRIPPPEVEGAAGGQGEKTEPAVAADADEDPVVATVDGQKIYWRDVVESARDLPEDARARLDTVAPALIGRLIDIKLLAAVGRKAGLDEDPQVRRTVSAVEDRAIGELLLRRWTNMRITDDVLRARYDSYRQDLAEKAEVRARHILLDDEDKAWQIIIALESGADFATLARHHSLGDTAELGGTLDYFTRHSMVPEFATAAFGLAIGEYSRTPVRTRFGWHIIKVEDHRAEAPVPFAEMRERLHDEARREVLLDLLNRLRAEAVIEVYPAPAP